MRSLKALMVWASALFAGSPAAWGQVRSGVLLATSLSSSEHQDESVPVALGSGAMMNARAQLSLQRFVGHQDPVLPLPPFFLPLPLSVLAALAADAPDEGAMSPSNTGTITFVSETGELPYQVSAVREWREVATCRTPCTLRLSAGHYTLRAEWQGRVFHTSVDLHGMQARRVRFGVEDWLDSQAGLVVTTIGVGVAAVSIDHLTFAPFVDDPKALPLASLLVQGFNRDLAIALGVGLIPAAVGLVAAGMSLTSNSHDRRVVVEQRRRQPRFGLSATSGQYLRGGGILGIEFEY